MMNKITKFIEGNDIYLRPYSESDDLEMFYFGENNAKVRDSLFLFSPLTMEEAKHKIATWISSDENKIFTICESSSNIPLGITALFRIDYVSRAATFYIAIYNPDFWSKGYGKEATRLMLKFSFDILNLNRIQLHVAITNSKGIHAYQSAGFVIEGTLRQAMYHNNEYVDFYVMSVLRDEYYNNQR